MPNDMNVARYVSKSYGPPAELYDDTVAEPANRFADAEAWNRAAVVAPASWNEAALTFEAVIATPHPVRRRDPRGDYWEVLDPATCDLSDVEGLPVYDAHRGGTARQTLGIVQSVRREGETLVATIRMSLADDVTPHRQRIADGTIRAVSIGYIVVAWKETRDAAGNRVKTPTAWTLKEVSLVPNPADPNARIRAQPPLTPREKGMRMEQEVQNRTAEIERRSEIRTLCRAAGLDDANTDALIDGGATVDEAKAALWDHVQSRSASRPVIRTTTAGNDDPATIIRRQSDALATRMTGVECPADARQHLGESFKDMARSSCERAGISTRGMNDDKLFHRAAHSNSDFPLLVSNSMNKVALEAYQAAESPLKKLCRQRVLPNFKPSTSIRFDGMGRLEELAENGEITHTTRAESGETMRLHTYARGLTVSRELLINDDLGLLGDMTMAFGAAAAQTEAETLVDLILDNPDLSDGAPVFDAPRGNLASPGVEIGGAGDDAAFNVARKFMRTAKGLGGQIISATPKYLLVGPESETKAEQFLANIYATTTEDVNAWAGKLTLLVEPRIPDERWMIFADPARLPCLQYGYLASAQGVQIQRAEAWDSLGLKFRAWLDFGAGWLDWRGVYLNEGGV